MGSRSPEYRGYAAGRKKTSAQKRSGRFLVMLAVLAVLVLLVRSRIFVVREIEVAGNLIRQDAEIAGLSGIRLGMSIFSVDKEELNRNISADNYVELQEVNIQLPDTVTIRVRERTPCAAVNSAGVIMLVDREGYILERLTYLPDIPGVVVVSGIDVSVGAQSRMIGSGTAGQMAVMQKLLSALQASGVQKLVSELNVADQNNLYLVSESGIQILLGDEERLDEKLLWMKAVLEELTGRGVMSGVLDVSSGKNAVYADR